MPTKPMSEKRWLDSLEPEPMLDFLDGKITARKLRLIACAACRFVWDKLVDDRSRRAVVVAELFADGRASNDEREEAFKEASSAFGDLGMAYGDISSAAAAVHNACWYGDDFLVTAKRSLACAADVGTYQAAQDVDSGRMAHAPNWENLVNKREKGKMARLVREVVGNPFKTVAIETARLTPAVIGLARTIYEQQAFQRLPEVAALLEANGYKGNMVLDHCRDSRPHYRGCWAVDLVLGKS
jgi:hypothetical protein